MDGKKWWYATDVCKLLGNANTAATIARVAKKHRTTAYIGYKKVSVLDEDGVRRLVVTSRKSVGVDLARELGIPMDPCKEQDSIRVIKAALSHWKGIEQFRVGFYRIDLYFPTTKIAVECDENGHMYRDSDYEETRQSLISNFLGCRFVRFNPDEEGFNIGHCINKIILMDEFAD